MMASVVASGNRGRAQRLRGVDPETCMIVFKNHWAQVLRVLERYDPGRSGAGSSGPIPADEASAVQNYAEHMLVLLMEEPAGAGGAMGPILEFVILESVMERLFLWSLRRQFTDDMKLEQLRMYSMLIGQAQQPLLHHKPILRPLMMLLSSCSASSSAAVEAELVGLLHQLCFAVAQDPSVLELFFHTSEDQGAANFLLFSLLIPYTHREGPVGDKARNALLLIMSLSAHNCRVANHIADQTYFCPVLATGLSGLYSSLPARLEVYSEDWHSLQPADWLQVPSLIHFLHSLQFCSTVSQVAHPSIKSQLLGYIYNGFLVPVVAPALHKLTLEEVMTSTAYLELFLRSISDPALLHTFLSFILMHRHDNVHILDTLVSRINTPFQLGTVSLALFRTLIGLHCEDVMLQLILRFLIPCTHVVSGVRERLRERDCYSSAAAALLSLTPTFLHQNNTQQDCILWTKVTEGFLKGNMGLDDLLTSSATVGYWRFLGGDSLTDSNYLQYLREAHEVVGACVWACQVWSAPYDGLRPSPEDYRDEEEERQQQEERARRRAEREREEDAVLPFVSSSQALSNVPPAAAPAPTSASISAPAPAADPSSGGQDLEWEWDDMFEAGMEAGMEAGEAGVAVKAVEPPQHLVEMRRSAISLVQGSYVEEAEFQDDVLVYSLIAQRDSRTESALTNGLDSEMDHSGDHSNAQTGTGTQDCAQNGLDHNCHPSQDYNYQRPQDYNYQHPKDFVSQCLELIQSLGWEAESIMGDEEFRERVQRLSCALQEEVELSFEDAEPLKLTQVEADGTNNQKQGQDTPFTGPFISVLLSRLENLLENSIEVNLLVTGILAQLASFPQPLLRSYLLSTQAIFQPGVRTLYQVLGSVRDQLERYAEKQTGFAELVREAGLYLLTRDQALRERERAGENGESWFPIGQVLRPLPRCPKIPPAWRSRVYAAVLFGEFLKELSALAQEHTTLLEPSEG
ncbi:FHF complex subunit HOOK-interacting protein 1A [Sardina pilchardus]|uniref:FHF complex subunit HOOK-interacting protein 1A n=1 Tax=Sardina pilchardus TaxID=27697 RepID=UPI002E1564EE